LGLALLALGVVTNDILPHDDRSDGWVVVFGGGGGLCHIVIDDSKRGSKINTHSTNM
jgi:hypothetical protein